MPYQVAETEILRVLRGYNPWWATGTIGADLAKTMRRLAFYETRTFLRQAGFNRAVMLSGARRVGKTTVLYQLAHEALLQKEYAPNEILYVSFDHPILKMSSPDRILSTFGENVAPGVKRSLLLLDEIHYADDWASWLKFWVDTNPYCQIVATGSASSSLAIDGAESGVGRWATVRVPTLSFYEYLRLMRVETPALPRGYRPTRLVSLSKAEAQGILTKCLPLQTHFHRYLLTGGFPEVALIDNLISAQRLLREDVVDKVLKRDMTALFNVRNVIELERVFIYLCLHSGQILIQDTLSKEIGVARPTVASYLKCLEAANLVNRLDPLDLDGKKSLKPRPKIYLADPSIREAVLLRGDDALTDSDEMGLIVETAVVKHLLSFYYRETPRFGYWREPKSGQEVDFITALPNGAHIAVEVKYSEQPSVKKGEGLYLFAQAHKATDGLVITKNPADYGPLPEAQTPAGAFTPFQIPAFLFLYLLGEIERGAVGG